MTGRGPLTPLGTTWATPGTSDATGKYGSSAVAKFQAQLATETGPSPTRHSTRTVQLPAIEGDLYMPRPLAGPGGSGDSAVRRRAATISMTTRSSAVPKSRVSNNLVLMARGCSINRDQPSPPETRPRWYTRAPLPTAVPQRRSSNYPIYISPTEHYLLPPTFCQQTTHTHLHIHIRISCFTKRHRFSSLLLLSRVPHLRSQQRLLLAGSEPSCRRWGKT